MKLTVIVPVYNAEKYLCRCLDSLLNQELKEDEYEILCINDGSTDRSESILEDYHANYPSLIRILKQNNQGVSAARNRGLDEAKGEIVTFCDSDDYLIPGSYRYLINSFWTDSLDVLRFIPKTLDRYLLKNWTEDNDFTGVVQYEGLGRDVFQHPFFASVDTHFYRKNFLRDHGLMLPNMIMDEDRVFNLFVYMANPSVRVCTSCVYRYTVNDDQTTTRRNPDKMRLMLPDLIHEFKCCNDIIQSCASEPKLAAYLSDRRFFRTSAFFSRFLSAKLDKRMWMSYITELKEIGWIPLPFGGLLALCVRMICSSYIFYFYASICCRLIFEPYILPRISRN